MEEDEITFLSFYYCKVQYLKYISIYVTYLGQILSTTRIEFDYLPKTRPFLRNNYEQKSIFYFIGRNANPFIPLLKTDSIPV